jgi:hypothetical protein
VNAKILGVRHRLVRSLRLLYSNSQ